MSSYDLILITFDPAALNFNDVKEDEIETRESEQSAYCLIDNLSMVKVMIETVVSTGLT